MARPRTLRHEAGIGFFGFLHGQSYVRLPYRAEGPPLPEERLQTVEKLVTSDRGSHSSER